MEDFIQQYAFFSALPGWVVLSSIVLVVLIFGYRGAPLWLWAVAGFSALIGFGSPVWLVTLFLVLVILFNVKPVRRVVLSGPILKLLDALNILPAISETEQTAIDAGTVWVEGELFSGKPDQKKMLGEVYPSLSEKEQAFMDGPVEELCGMVSDWEVFQKKEFSDEVWDFMKERDFSG